MEATENEVILAFLQAEAQSPRFAAAVSRNYKGNLWDLVYRADLNDKKQNAERRRILGKTRGWGRGKLLFENLDTSKLRWERFDDLSFEEVEYWNYVNHPQPNALSENSRSVGIGASNVTRKFVPGWSDQILDIVKQLVRGVPMPPLIALEARNGGTYLLEGHTRATAYVLNHTEPITAYIGYWAPAKWCRQRI